MSCQVTSRKRSGCMTREIVARHSYRALVDGLATEQLPFYHRDPFDRLLLAQALVENAAIVTRDSRRSAETLRHPAGHGLIA